MTTARPIIRASVLLVALFVIGTVGFAVIAPERSLLDAAYMTVITLTTVGFGEASTSPPTRSAACSRWG